MIKIKIGADELILWLRKNNKANSIPNDEIQGLGRKIHDLIVGQLGGKKVNDDYPSYWANLDEVTHIDKFGLPKSSAQYEINTSELERLYVELNNW
ncbi:MAG: hypothetical protein EZS26_001378 [Candidatus Ordinivivax streblomastigis]|uniref:Uncharacterized protein n=1 Tax=Candidatus Ordinivivax streblomastigis TaxID=2540710 RepID=A0A5M8P2J2_9BACT|nr:MAG: hypothetical protein EZS26_001378 [Candidatus Ordinivivax streblomastigis]